VLARVSGDAAQSGALGCRRCGGGIYRRGGWGTPPASLGRGGIDGRGGGRGAPLLRARSVEASTGEEGGVGHPSCEPGAWRHRRARRGGVGHPSCEPGAWRRRRARRRAWDNPKQAHASCEPGAWRRQRARRGAWDNPKQALASCEPGAWRRRLWCGVVLMGNAGLDTVECRCKRRAGVPCPGVGQAAVRPAGVWCAGWQSVAPLRWKGPLQAEAGLHVEASGLSKPGSP
jgi:hypothetical protein